MSRCTHTERESRSDIIRSFFFFFFAEANQVSLCADLARDNRPLFPADSFHAVPNNSHRRQIDARTSNASVVRADKFAAVSRKRWTRVSQSNRVFACEA